MTSVMRLAPIVALMLVPIGAFAQVDCPALTEEEALARADVVFEGIAQPGPQADNGVLATPARFGVTRYIKGSGRGPPIVSVAGGPKTEGIGFISLPSAGVRARSGDRWVIYAKGAPDGIVETSTCYGTHLAGAPKPFVSKPAPTLPSPSPTPTGLGSEQGRWPWGVSTAVGIGAIALVMGVGYATGIKVVGTR